MEGIVRLHEKIKAGVPPAYEIRGVALSEPAYDGGSRASSRPRDRRTARRRSSSTRPARRGVHAPARRGRASTSSPTSRRADYLGWGERGVAGYIGTPRRARPRTAPARRATRACPTRSRSASRSATTCSRSATGRAAVRVQVVARRRRGGRQRRARSGRPPTGSSARRGTCTGIRVPRPPEPAPDPDGRRLGRPPAAQGLPDRRRARPLLGRGLTVADRPAQHADLRGLAHPEPDPDRAQGRRRRSTTSSDILRSTSARTTRPRTACCA